MIYSLSMTCLLPKMSLFVGRSHGSRRRLLQHDLPQTRKVAASIRVPPDALLGPHLGGTSLVSGVSVEFPKRHLATTWQGQLIRGLC